MNQYDIVTYETVLELVDNLGYKLISKKYKNAKQKLILKDKDGYLYYSTYTNLYSKKKPIFVSCYNIFSIRNIKNYIKINDLSCELISEKYINSRDFLLFKCKCGRQYKCSWGKFSTRKKDICNICSQKEKSYKRRHSIEFIRKQFAKYGYKPLFDNYINCEIPLLCQDKNGYYGYLSYANLNCGFDFAPFKTKNPYVIHNIKQYILNNSLRCNLLTDKISKGSVDNLNDTVLTFECMCKEYYKTTWASFTTNKVDRCPKCSKKKSQYALMTEEYLKSRNYDFKEEFTFPDCMDVSLLYFDYIVYNQDNFMLIEVDGQFHYENPYDESLLKGQKRRDKIKNDYCLKNDIHLIRIPYWEYKSDGYKKIIEKGFKKIQS